MPSDWSREILHQSGVLYQGSAPRGGAACVDVRGHTLLLAPLSGQGRDDLEVGRETAFEVITPAGILRVAGTFAGMREIEINGVAQLVAAVEANPLAVERVNRRAHHRVAVTLKGAFAVYDPQETPAVRDGEPARPEGAAHLEVLAEVIAERSRPCTVRDLGLGGARIATAPPAPKRGSLCLFDLALGPGQRLRNLPARIIESRTLPGTSPLQLEVRVRFEGLARTAEAHLSRYLTQQQLELLRKGIRA